MTEDLRTLNSGQSETLNLGGAQVNLMDIHSAVSRIFNPFEDSHARPLAVVSVNLDHVEHFGAGARWEGTLDGNAGLDWLYLADGSPLLKQAKRITGRQWPRLAGSDLIRPILQAAQAAGRSVGFVGGSAETHDSLRATLATEWPNLAVAGFWAPTRESLFNDEASNALASEIASTRVDILVVCLGKPRQELWIAEYGAKSGASVLLAFGAAVDFLAGRISRAPRFVSSHGMEWAWRLAFEPKRLARRYLVDGPEAYLKLRRASSQDDVPRTLSSHREHPRGPQNSRVVLPEAGSFMGSGVLVDVAVVVVMYENACDVDPLIAGLRDETRDQTMRVIVVDNSPGTETSRAVQAHLDVKLIRAGGNLGYAGGINLAMAHIGDAATILILNPDVNVQRGTIAALRNRLEVSAAGVAVPLLLDSEGHVFKSLRREPTVTRACGDALLGRHVPSRPGWLSETDFDAESYRHAHRVEWATGAAMLIRKDVAERMGKWDERFFLYSEETEFFHHLRDIGESIWFEPKARICHRGAGSGSSGDLAALMAVNKIRYVRLHHNRTYSAAFHGAIVVAEALRSYQPSHRRAALAVVGAVRWSNLPHAIYHDGLDEFPTGAVIIPAHNEESVIGRTLDKLRPVLATGRVEAVVVCNACTDATADIARGYQGVRVVEIAEASKPAALNAADSVVKGWPRLYLDADVELDAVALRAVYSVLSAGQYLAVRPDFTYDSRGAEWLVRSYYRARLKLPTMHRHLWGAGVYALNALGHEKLGPFPDVTADDLFVDQMFSTDEKAVLRTPPVIVRTPRTRKDLISILHRTYRGKDELSRNDEGGPKGVLRELVNTVRGPLSAVDACIYVGFALAGRLAGTASEGGIWERDESSRRS